MLTALRVPVTCATLQEAVLRIRLRRSRRPILVGPWRGEVGFEALYWLPWLAWLLEGISPRRIYVISRGGAGSWYGVPPDQVLDLYTLRPLAEVRYQTHRSAVSTGAIKQTVWTRWDTSVLEQAVAVWRLPQRPLVVHPSLMYRVCEPYWRGRRPLDDILRRTRWTRLAPPPMTVSILPPRYGVARLYLRATLQADPAFRRRMCELLTRWATRMPVVLLECPHHLDDHMDLPLPDLPGVLRCPPVPPEQTLMQHAAVLGHAQLCLSPYGGIAQLALRMGVPSVSLYQHLQGTFLSHLLLSQTVAVQSGVGFTPVAVKDLDTWQALFR